MELDILSKFFNDILEDRKTFEIRKDKPNRKFHVGDVLLLKEIDDYGYTGREIKVEITYISNYIDGYKVLQIKKI